MPLRDIASRLSQQGVIRKETHFLIASKLLGVSRNLKAGHYLFKGKISNYRVLKKLSSGEVLTERVTLPEGIRATEVAGILQRTMGIDSTHMMDLMTSHEFCDSLHVDDESLEGYLYPDTYYFDYDRSPEDILVQIVSQFKNIFVDSLQQRAKELGFTVHQVVTLASIIEGEAVVPSERPIISAVYHNRLKRRMRLQADPTIQYLIKNGPRRLLSNDLLIESPYNTYLHYGLPPGPVNNPGLDCILAALYPASVDYLYMVANGDGAHVFSRTITEHLKAKNEFDKYRRKIRRLKK